MLHEWNTLLKVVAFRELEALFAEHCGPPPPYGNIEWASQKMKDIWNSKAIKEKIESLREQVRSVQQNYEVRHRFTITMF